MNRMLMGLVMVTAVTMGCAHGARVVDAAPHGRDVRGWARVGHEARAIIAGPAFMVHATGEKPVRWTVVARVNGGDSDCATPGSPATLLSESTGVHLTIAPGSVLCAYVARGTTEVSWHEVVEQPANLWALR